jgi:hypothetical protein
MGRSFFIEAPTLTKISRQASLIGDEDINTRFIVPCTRQFKIFVEARVTTQPGKGALENPG